MSTEGLIMDYSTMSSTGSAPCSTPGSPKDKVKFLCSHGGKILPRPLDGLLKYVGGETRIISVPRDIKFAELMRKLTYLIEGEMVLKYQLAPEDLDALVSVKSDEDLRHMIDEYDRNENAGAPRLRSFLFPSKPVVLENHMEIHGLEQRYIDAVNGFVRAPPPAGTKQRPVLHITRQPSFGLSPSDTPSPSPRSPEGSYTDLQTHELMPNNYHIHRGHMYRVQSSPSVYNLNGTCFQPVSYSSCYQNSRQQQQQSPYQQQQQQGGKPPSSFERLGTERLVSVKSVGRVEGSRYQIDQLQPFPPHAAHPYLCMKQHSRGGNGSCNKCMHYDEYSGAWMERRTEKGCSLPPSPLSLSPRAANSHNAMKPWDTAISGDS